ncbi:MAG: SMC-Scp complex subunit ScpB [Candidatus Dormibacteraeota bacterium]|nr:SMC-Scp complex subunit ScpB [Candidatus Dormibacteraeota bacterium]MDQ6899713.1 SMC-Scp complex subunit ScpB [Candidatus Dormibacteraeota bacterium]
MSAADATSTVAQQLRRRRTALGWTLEQVAEQAQVSVGMLSLIETGKRRPSLRSWQRIRQTLGISEPLPEEAWRLQPQEISDELVATLGACLAAVRAATLAELAEAVGLPISDVRLALRRLAEQLKVTGMQVLDDGSHVQLAPERRFHGAVAHLLQPEQQPRLSREQAEVLAIVISDGMATRRRIEEVRGAAQLSIGPGGALSLPRDSSETLALLLSRGLLCADRDDHAIGRPLVYRPTPRLLQLLGAETLEEARGRLGVPADYGFATKSIPGAGPFGHEAPADGAAE